jgi:hypothetical protein
VLTWNHLQISYNNILMFWLLLTALHKNWSLLSMLENISWFHRTSRWKGNSRSAFGFCEKGGYSCDMLLPYTRYSK